MNVIRSTVLRNNLSDSLKKVEKDKDFLLVSKRGKINSAIVNLDLLEDLLDMADSKYLDTIKKAREEYENGDIFSHDDVFGDI